MLRIPIKTDRVAGYLRRVDKYLDVSGTCRDQTDGAAAGNSQSRRNRDDRIARERGGN